MVIQMVAIPLLKMMTFDKKYEGKTFNVTYRTDLSEDEDGEEYLVYIIVGLELVE